MGCCDPIRIRSLLFPSTTSSTTFEYTSRFHGAIQYAHGPKGVYGEGDYLVASGQENPRTHFLGHTITLGAKSAVHKPEQYLLYRLLWDETR